MSETLSRASRYGPSAALVAILACFFGAIAPGYIARYRIGFGPAAGIYCCFVLTLVVVVTPGMRGPRAWIQGQFLKSRQLSVLKYTLIMTIWCVPYLAYAAGTGDWRWAAPARLIASAAPLLAIYGLFPVQVPSRFGWQDLAAAAWLAAVLLTHQLKGIWNVPANLDFMARLFLIGVASWTWVFVRPVPHLGYEFSFSAKTFGAAGLNFMLFAAMAIPASLLMGFTHWNPRPEGVGAFLAGFVEIFLFVALLEELFFRGFLQTLISAGLRSPWKGQALVSCLFGLFHILHPPVPNWKYVLLAAVAGWFYGSAFIKGGNLMASTLTHALVDTVWRNFF